MLTLKLLQFNGVEFVFKWLLFIYLHHITSEVGGFACAKLKVWCNRYDNTKMLKGTKKKNTCIL